MVWHCHGARRHEVPRGRWHAFSNEAGRGDEDFRTPYLEMYHLCYEWIRVSRNNENEFVALKSCPGN